MVGDGYKSTSMHFRENVRAPRQTGGREAFKSQHIVPAKGSDTQLFRADSMSAQTLLAALVRELQSFLWPIGSCPSFLDCFKDP